ncbi:MAG: V-type ATP synthase subunit I [Acutalibacteraceae bacterium]
MAKVKMQKINLYALRKNRKAIMEELQRLGVVQIEDMKLADSIFTKQNTAQSRRVFEKSSDTATQAADILNEYIPEKKSPLSTFEGRKTISVEDYYTFVDNNDEIMRVAYDINALQKEISDKKADIIRLETQKESLSVWGNLDVSLRFPGTKKTKAFIGTVTGSMTEDEIRTFLNIPNKYLVPQPLVTGSTAEDEIRATLAQKLPETDDYVVEVISTLPEQTCVFILAHNSVAEKLEKALRGLGFARPPLQPKQPPQERIKILDDRINQAKNDIENAENQIKSYVGMRNALKFIADYYRMRRDKYEAIELLSQSKRTFILTGYVSSENSQALEKLLTEKYDAVVEIEEPDENDDVPVKLKNNGFARPCEGVLETYSMPSRHEIDPTPIMAFFYYILFGLMFSDAGYGIIMIIACGFALLKFKNMEESLRKSVKMFFFCGFTTTFWGLLFGSFFGDSVESIATTFFHSDVSLPPLWFEPLTNPMPMLMFSFAVGIVHLFVGLGIAGYQDIRQKKYYDALCDVVFWYLLVGGLIVFFVTTDMFIGMSGLNFNLPSVVGTVAIICAAVGAVGILLTSGRDSKNPFKRLLKGLYGLYNVTGYLSDILSYSRLLALGLATGVIGTVFNKMASMLAGIDGGGIIGAILYILVFVIGHALNLGINALGAYVHTNRLQFVEFFGKFYDGGGRKFTPYKINTKNYKIKEDI